MDRESGWRATAKSQPALCPPFFLCLLMCVSQPAGCSTRQGVSQTDSVSDEQWQFLQFLSLATGTITGRISTARMQSRIPKAGLGDKPTTQC